jgi:hypothetical protein
MACIGVARATLAPVLAEALRDRARDALHALGPRAVDRRAREPGAHPGGVHGGTGEAHEQPRAAGEVVPSGPGDDVFDRDVEARHGRALDHRQAGAEHAGAHVGERHDRITGRRGGRRDSEREQRGDGDGARHDAAA